MIDVEHVVAAQEATLEAERGATVLPDGKLVAGQWVADLYSTRMLLGNLAPAEWEHVAAFLFALLERQPVAGSQAYAAERMLLGSLAWELRAYAGAAGEPVGLHADLRAASSKIEEQRIRDRIEASRAAFHEHISRVIDDGHAWLQRQASEPADDIPEAPSQPATAEEVPGWL